MWGRPRDCYWDTLKSLALTLFFQWMSFPVGEFVFHFQASKNVVFCTQIFMFLFQQTEWGQDLSLPGGPQPHWWDKAAGMCVCEGLSTAPTNLQPSICSNTCCNFPF